MLKAFVDKIDSWLMSKYLTFVLALLIGAVFIYCFLQPIQDGDFFWQMEYGRYLWENKTLIPDHSIYSWTPTDNTIIYCAWITELILFFIYSLGGLPLAFVFKILCMAIPVGVLFWYAYRTKQINDPLLFLLVLVLELISASAAYIKPEILSYVLFALTAGLYFAMKSKLLPSLAWYIMPLFYLIWFNTHGVAFSGLAMFGCMVTGEIINYYLCPKNALPADSFFRMIAAGVLSAASSLGTPYGIRLYIHIFENYMNMTKDMRLLATTVEAWKSTLWSEYSFSVFIGLVLLIIAWAFCSRKLWKERAFDQWLIGALLLLLIYYNFAISGSYYDFLLVGCIVLLFSFGHYAKHFWNQRAVDWGLTLPLLFLAYMYIQVIRAVYYLPMFWALGIIYTRSFPDSRLFRSFGRSTLPKLAVIILIIFISHKTLYLGLTRPRGLDWTGLGIGYLNPVAETQFLKQHKPGTKLYNSYDIGGYLLHALYPTYKIFMDPRGFPYHKWYKEYWAFNSGGTPIMEFEKKYPFDVAIVDYKTSESPIYKFLRAKDWVPVHYGPSAMIFVKKTVAFNHSFKSDSLDRFEDLKSILQASNVLMVAQNLGDLDASAYLLDLIRRKFSFFYGYEEVLEKGQKLHDGLVALQNHEYQKALDALESAKEAIVTARLELALLNLRNWKAKELISKGNIKGAYDKISATLQMQPGYIDGLYNVGILGFRIQQMERSKTAFMTSGPVLPGLEINYEWKSYLERFLQTAPDHKYADIARTLLNGGGLPQNTPLAF